MRRLMVMALPLLLAIPVAAQEQDADDSTEIGSGMASYYGDRFAGNRTASGERFDPDELTAAHRTLAFGRHVRVTNLANRSEEHTSELQSLMRISYAVFCSQKK